ncbi:hypothetical protein M514_12388 [Trichuris suis]|uniref:Uncharacterized protein n=1 Tax=Trichuris suis TaxID=68888 RepID=A0A085NTQ1_9BILA|nr:hypothetical protein M514_12388 [Trichuris suis]
MTRLQAPVRQSPATLRRSDSYANDRVDVVPGETRASATVRHSPNRAAAAPLRVDVEEAVETR